MLLPINKSTKDPITAITNEFMSKPVIPTPNTRLARNPPTSAPAIPRIIAPTKPPFAGRGSITFATTPATKPKTIHANTFTTFSPPFDTKSDLYYFLRLRAEQKISKNLERKEIIEEK